MQKSFVCRVERRFSAADSAEELLAELLRRKMQKIERREEVWIDRERQVGV